MMLLQPSTRLSRLFLSHLDTLRSKIHKFSRCLKETLTLAWRGSPSYRNQSTDLQSKSLEWFLYDRDLRHERVKDMYCKARLNYRDLFRTLSITHDGLFAKIVNPLHITVSFYTPGKHQPGKHQKTRGFLMFSGGIERDQLQEMG